MNSKPDLSAQARIERSLCEYAHWRAGEPPSYGSGQSIFQTIRECRDNAGAVGPGLRPAIVDGVACRPDGGLGRLADHLGRQIARDNRCREVHDLLPYLPGQHRKVFDATYIGLPREVPRREREAADRLGWSLTKYQKMKYGMLCWFEGTRFRATAARPEA